jgi:hypothetical protein
MVDDATKKLIKDEIQKALTQVSDQIRRIQLFSEAYLLILLDLSLINDPCERLKRVLSAVSTDFPQPLLQIYVRKSVLRAKKSEIDFEEYADCLVKGLGDRVKELTLTDEINRVYGSKAGERWKKIVGSSDNPKTDCACKASTKFSSRRSY